MIALAVLPRHPDLDNPAQTQVTKEVRVMGTMTGTDRRSRPLRLEVGQSIVVGQAGS